MLKIIFNIFCSIRACWPKTRNSSCRCILHVLKHRLTALTWRPMYHFGLLKPFLLVSFRHSGVCLCASAELWQREWSCGRDKGSDRAQTGTEKGLLGHGWLISICIYNLVIFKVVSCCYCTKRWASSRGLTQVWCALGPLLLSLLWSASSWTVPPLLLSWVLHRRETKCDICFLNQSYFNW